ncbi:MAG: hypothetical protein GY753_06900 [Gammaproteobacteria bacterium]|nr:hypothetical protein [Gammaproteobacteria bacterium]
MSRQLDQELEALNEGASRRSKKNARQVSREQETDSAPGRIALSRAILPLAVGISDWLDGTGAGVGKKVKPFFRLLSPELTSTIIARAVMDGISRQRKRTALAGAIGRALQTEYQLQQFKENHLTAFQTKMLEHRHEGDRSKERHILSEARRQGIINRWWNRGDQIAVGMTALMLMEKHTGMIMLYHRLESGRRVGFIAPTPAMEEWLEESYRLDGMRGILYEPMVEPPNDWVDNFTGGYNLEEFQTKGFINAKEGNHYNDLTYEDCPDVFDAVNAIQRTAWSVNTKVLSVIQTLWKEGSTIAGLPDCSILKEPDFPESSSKDEMRRRYRELQRIRATNSMNVGRRFRLDTSIKTAEKFSEEPAIYFPHHLDFRGRAYPMPNVFNPQGDDVARGLLQFAEGKAITTPSARQWFLVHGANLWGFKGPFADRVHAIEAMHTDILTILKDPLSHTVWAQASEPFQFLAWCFEYGEWQENRAFTSHIPCAMDGSNNGLQLMSLLLRDQDMGYSTGCMPSATPSDIYQDVADGVKRRLQSDPTTEHLALLRYGVDRALMKKAVMSVPYGSSYFSITRQFQETVYARFIDGDELPFDGRLHSHCAALATATWETIKTLMPQAIELMEWLKDTIRPAIENNEEVSWTTPMGLQVYQGYRRTIRRRVVTAIGSKVRKEAYYQDPLDILSTRNNLRAIVPNFIHSLDSSVMMATANLMESRGINSLAMVHDSFATHAADAPELARGLREAAINTFKDNLLDLFDKDVRRSYPTTHENAEAPPALGKLELSELQKSLYFFH